MRRRAVSVVGGLVAVAAMLSTAGSAGGQDPPDSGEGFVVPEDTWFGEQWSLFGWGQTVGSVVATTASVDVRAPEAWAVTRGDPGVIVAVLDTGVDGAHPDLVANLWTNAGETGDGRESNGIDDDGNGYVDDWRGWDFIDGDNDPSDVRGPGQSGELPVAHGTGLASIIAADDDGWGMVGLAPDVTVMVLRATQGDALGEALEYALAQGASVVNLSLINPIQFLESGFDAVHAVMLEHPEAVYVAAAGNVGWDQDLQGAKPCTFDDVPTLICVAATDETDELATFFAGGSGFGALTVDLAAPGDNLLVAQPALAALVDGGFEDDDSAGWSFDGGWDRSDVAVHGGSAAAGIDAAAIPLDDVGALLTAPDPLDVGGLFDCRVAGWVLVETDRSAALWFEWLSRREGVPDNWVLSVGNGGFSTVQDTGGQWQRFDFAAPDAFLRDGEFGFRFSLRSARDLAPHGHAAIDDVSVTCQGDAIDVTERNAFAYAEGTSYATPMVSAAAALVRSAHPELTALEVRTAILDGVHPVGSLDGVVATGGRLDVFGAIERAAALSRTDPASPSAAPSDESTSADSTPGGGLIAGLQLPDLPLTVPSTRGGQAQPGAGASSPPTSPATESEVGVAGAAPETSSGATDGEEGNSSGVPGWLWLVGGAGGVGALGEWWRRRRNVIDQAAAAEVTEQEMKDRARIELLQLYTRDREAFMRVAPDNIKYEVMMWETKAGVDPEAGNLNDAMSSFMSTFGGPLGDVAGWFSEFGERLGENQAQTWAAREARVEAEYQRLRQSLGAGLTEDDLRARAYEIVRNEDYGSMAVQTMRDVGQAGADATLQNQVESGIVEGSQQATRSIWSRLAFWRR